MEWDLRTGDTIVTDNGTYLIISSADFDLTNDEGYKANIILLGVERGCMEGYDNTLDDLWKYYSIREIIPNKKSYERLNG